jgi:hypothetical protein
LYYENPQYWAQQLEKDSNNLESALNESNYSAAKNNYRRYRRSAGIRFFKVDVELKNLCSDLRRVGEPLDRVLRMLGDDAGRGGNNEPDE